MKRQLSIFEDARITFDESVNLTVDSMNAYGPLYDFWVFCWSGG